MFSDNALAAITTVNSDSDKEIGFNSMYKIVSRSFSEVPLPRKNIVLTLETGTKSTRIKNDVIESPYDMYYSIGL